MDQQGSKLAGSDGAGSHGQGHTVAISADGNTALIGGPTVIRTKGTVSVFARMAGVWSQQQ